SRSFGQEAIRAGVSLTLGPAAVFSMTNELILEHGDQSKPYRYIPMFAPENAAEIPKGAPIDLGNEKRIAGERPLEALPLSRQRIALTARFGYRFTHATLRIDERLYTDSWHLHATTTEARYYVDLSRRFSVWPWVRFHAQTPVYFWSRAYVSRMRSGIYDGP